MLIGASTASTEARDPPLIAMLESSIFDVRFRKPELVRLALKVDRGHRRSVERRGARGVRVPETLLGRSGGEVRRGWRAFDASDLAEFGE